jgi:hypothetical protein
MTRAFLLNATLAFFAQLTTFAERLAAQSQSVLRKSESLLALSVPPEVRFANTAEPFIFTSWNKTSPVGFL